MYATSSGLRCVFTSTTEPCNLATAAHTSKNATEFGNISATRSFAPTPRAASPRAMRSVARVEVDVRGGEVVLDESRLLGSARRGGGRAKLGELHPPSVEVP